jgi:hypothetical protein
MNNGIAAWNNDPNSNVNLVNAGADGSGTHTGGVVTPDGQNTVAFERNLFMEFGAAFTCGGMSYGGLLGVGGVNNDSGTHIGPNGETFFTSAEGDVEMNQGLSACAAFGVGNFSSSVAHELGHTLGFRHADETRDLTVHNACSGDASLECATNAIMKAFIPNGLNGALQAWDQHAVDGVYPNPTILPPTGVTAAAQTSTSVLISWTAANGAASYRVYRTANNSTYMLVGSPVGTSFTDMTASANTAYLYKVRSFNVSESADSNKDLATTVIFTDSTLTLFVTPIKAVHVTQIRTAVNAVQTLVGTANTAYTNPTLDTSVTVKKAHIDEPLTRLNAARTTAGLTTISLSGGAITQFVTPVRASDINSLRGGVQ